MTGDSRMTIHKGMAMLAAALLVGAGAGTTFLLTRGGLAPAGHVATPAPDRTPQPSHDTHSSALPTTSKAALPDVVVTLAQDAVERAGIVVSPVSRGVSTTELRLPASVQPNGYRQVAVTALVSGRIASVIAQLGDRVRRGQTMAQIYSPELAEAETRFVAARAMLEAHEQELQRTEKLVEIGAASRQELERIHAEHAAQTAAVQSARSQLELLGMPRSVLDAPASTHAVGAARSVPAPIDGVVTERVANTGLNVDPATKLFTVVDLSNVWVVADVYETEFSRVRVGSDVTVTASAFPDLEVRARVSYVDPQVDAETRTGKVRVEVPNVRGDLRLGMYVDVVIADAGGEPVPVISSEAVQNVGDRTVVYLAMPNEPRKFIEREVRLGKSSRSQVEVLSGVQVGDRVVARGSFFVRAERERLGLRTSAE
jgi:membrane fusion protein, heavy metal efflux system